MSVSKALRYQVLRRDGFTCRYCGGKAPDVALRVDHVIPAALGGSDEPANLTTACQDCNSGKAATPPDAATVEQVDQRAFQWAEAMAAIAAEEQQERAGLDWFTTTWDGYRYGDKDDPRGIPLPPNWRASLETWLRSGLTRADIEHATATAMGNTKVPVDGVFRYMAGICWRTLERREINAARRFDG